MNELLSFSNVSVIKNKKSIITNASFKINEQDFFMIAGPNGAGKTTLIRALSGETGYDGQITLKGTDIRTLSSRDFAKKVGILSQKSPTGLGFTVREVVELGRYSHASGLIPRLSALDMDIIDDAIEQTGLADFADRNILTLSGGEYQRVLLARLIAQNPEILVLDEPSNHLDFPNQLRLFEFLKDWVDKNKKTVLAVVHDFNLVKAYGTRAVLLNASRIHAEGKIKEVFCEKNLLSVYGVDIAEWMRLQLKSW